MFCCIPLCFFLFCLLVPLCICVCSCFSHCAELLCTYALITVFVDYPTFMNFWYHCAPVFFFVLMLFPLCRTAVHLRPDHGVCGLSHLYDLLVPLCLCFFVLMRFLLCAELLCT